MTEQSVVVKKLYTVIISQVRDVFDMAHQDANQWSKNVLAPLVQQIKEHIILLVPPTNITKGDPT
jgi:hypothetical protein